MSATPPTAPAAGVLEQLRQIWAEVLGLDSIAGGDDFFELGGDSLKACEVVRRLAGCLRLSLDPLEVFENPRLRDFAATVRALSSQPPTEVAGRRGVLPPFAPAARPERIPLSSSQKAWMVTDRLAPLEQRVLLVRRLKGSLNVGAMEQALYQTRMNHEILRTRFVTCAQGYQEILHIGPQSLSLEDLAGVPAGGREDRLWERLHEAYRAPIPEGGPMLELRLFRFEKDDHYLAGFISRLAFDAPSVEIFWRELFDNYRCAAFGGPFRQPCGAPQFADFALWEASLLSPARLQEGHAFWRSRLERAEPLRFPGVPSPMDKPSRWGMVPLDPRGVPYSAVARFARDAAVTIPILLLGATALALARWTHQRRPLLGTVVNARPPGLGQTIGCFIQLRPFCIDVSGDPTFEELMAMSRRAYIEANALSMPPPPELLTQMQAASFLVNITAIGCAATDESERGLGFIVKRRSLATPLKAEVSRDIALNLSYGAGALDGWIMHALDRTGRSEVRDFAVDLMSIIASGIRSPGSHLATFTLQGRA